MITFFIGVYIGGCISSFVLDVCTDLATVKESAIAAFRWPVHVFTAAALLVRRAKSDTL